LPANRFAKFSPFFSVLARTIRRIESVDIRSIFERSSPRRHLSSSSYRIFALARSSATRLAPLRQGIDRYMKFQSFILRFHPSPRDWLLNRLNVSPRRILLDESDSSCLPMENRWRDARVYNVRSCSLLSKTNDPLGRETVSVRQEALVTRRRSASSGSRRTPGRADSFAERSPLPL